MNFKDQLTLDLSVFLNPAEFGEQIRIEGLFQPVTAVCDWSVEPEGEHLYAATDSWGVNRVHATVQLAEAPITEAFGVLSPGCELTINKQNWTVRGVSTCNGLMTLNLYRNAA